MSNNGDFNGFEKVSFRTEDGFVIHGNLIRKDKEAIVLLHQLGLSKESYNDFAKRLGDNNFTVLAIDLRGHGDSLEQNGVIRRFVDFSESDFRSMEKDVEAAKKFLMQEGFVVSSLVGSSIGANTSLNFASHDESIKKVVLLSPGLNYKGIETLSNANSVKARVLIVASLEDEYSFGSSKALLEKIRNAEMIELKGAGHGTYMFNGTNLESRLIEWLKQ